MFPHPLQKRLFIDHLSGLGNDDRGHWPTACRPCPGGSIDAPAGNRPRVGSFRSSRTSKRTRNRSAQSHSATAHEWRLTDELERLGRARGSLPR
jgi:hypothetical protein